MAQNPTQRGYFDAFLDRLGAWHRGLSPERTSYTTQEVRIPLENEEHIQLAATVYQPFTHKQHVPAAGTILVQSPYGRRPLLSLMGARLWAARGYTVLMVSVRGTFGSDGEMDPLRYEQADAPRIVRWMRKQPWYTGSFATWGMSYLGYAQWALMASEEPLDDMAAAIISCGPHDWSDLVWGTGAFWLCGVDWANMISRQESLSWWRELYRMVTVDPNGELSVKKVVPLIKGLESYFGPDSPEYKWLHEWVKNEDIENDSARYWETMNQSKGLRRECIPILLLGGWQDLFISDTVTQYEQLKASGCTVGMTIGPWSHMEVGSSGEAYQEILDWLDTYLANKTTDGRQEPVRINVTGSNDWRWLPSWPPATQPLELFLESDGRISRERTPKTDECRFTFDPHDPTPTIGGNLLYNGGSVNDAALARRADVLHFDLPPLHQDLLVIGRPHVELLHSSDNPHVDIFVRLSEVNSKGISNNLCEVYKRLDPGRALPGNPVKIELDLSPLAHQFKKGTQIRLLIAGGNFPHYTYNLGSGEPNATGTTLRLATHTVHTGEGGCKLVLPVTLV